MCQSAGTTAGLPFNKFGSMPEVIKTRFLVGPLPPPPGASPAAQDEVPGKLSPAALVLYVASASAGRGPGHAQEACFSRVI